MFLQVVHQDTGMENEYQRRKSHFDMEYHLLRQPQTSVKGIRKECISKNIPVMFHYDSSDQLRPLDCQNV